MLVYRKYNMRERVERLIQHEAKLSAVFALRHPPSAVFFVHTSIGGALSVILNFLVVLRGAIFSSTQTAAIFGDQDISKSLYNLFLAVEQTNRISWASLVIYNVTHVIKCAVLVESLRDQTISKCYTIYF